MPPATLQQLQDLLATLNHDPVHCVYRHLSRAARVVTALYDEAFAPHGLTAGQFTVLLTLARLGPLNVGELAKHLAMDTTTVPRVLRPLVARRLAEIRQGTDRRVRVVSITEQGIGSVLAAVPTWERTQARVLEALPGQQWAQLRHGIAALRHGHRAPDQARQAS